MNRIFLHYVDWPNTQGNHAGMAYICDYLSQNDEMIILKEFRVVNFRGRKYFNFLNALFHICFFLVKTKRGDTIFFMEYLTKGYAYQELISKVLSLLKPSIKMNGLVHLTGKGLLNSYKNENTVKKHLNHLHKIIVLGSSLKKFFISIGIQPNKVVNTFHFVDTDYYKPLRSCLSEDFNVLVQGNQLRDYKQLKNIVSKCPKINFTIMQGVNQMQDLFSGFNNVSLIGYVDEDVLLGIMQNSDVALSVMRDTVGSNVITTSMACGLAMVVTDVGSIRDYCSDDNAIFCKEVEDYVIGLDYLFENRDVCNRMKDDSRVKSLLLDKKMFLKDFQGMK